MRVKGSCRRGFVLVAALVAIVIIALLVTGAFFASGQEMGIARNELRDQQALELAEYAIARAVAGWDAPTCDSLRAGQTVGLPSEAAGALESSVFITRLDTALYAIVADVRVAPHAGSGLRRRVGVVVRTVRDGVPVNPPIRVSEHPWTALY